LIGDAGGLAGRNAAPAITAPHPTTDPDGDSAPPSEYWTERAKPAPGTFPGLSLSAESTYVIILESSIPHGTPGSSQQLPDLPFFGVIGSVVPGDLTDFYRLSLGSTSSSLDLGLISGAGGSDVPLQLQVFDGSGRVLAEWHSATQGDSPLHLELGGLAAGSTIYLGISTAGSSWASPAKAADYQLWVGLQTGARTSAANGLDSVAPSSLSPIFALAPATTAGIAIPAASGSSQSTPATAPAATGTSLAVAGSPEIRSSRPAGGLLTRDDPSSQTDREALSSVPQPWVERTLAGAAPRSAASDESTAAGKDEKGDKALAVIDGPGGFPLIGAVAIGHRRGIRGEVRGTPSEFPTAEVRAPGIDLDPEAIGELATIDAVAAEIGQETRAGNRTWGGFPVSIFSGLGLATVMTLNAVLSQPMAGFDFLCSRLEARPAAPRPRRRRERR